MSNSLNRCLSFAVVFCFAASAAHAQVTQFPLHTRPEAIVAGADGNLWFTEPNANRIARISTAGVVVEFPVPTAASNPLGIAIGREGDVWFTERFANRIGRYTPATGAFREYPVTTPSAQPWNIALGPDGNLWFTEEAVNQIGRLTPSSGLVSEFVPPTCCSPIGITAGPDGRMWYTQEARDDAVGRVDMSGAITTYPLLTGQVFAWDIHPGPDGALWLSELGTRSIGRVTTDGAFVGYAIPGPRSGTGGVCAGPDGNLWFTELDADLVGMMDTAGAVHTTLGTGRRPVCIALGPDANLWFTEIEANAIGRVTLGVPSGVHVLSLDAAFSPRIRRAHLGERIQWTFLGPSPHSVVDSSGLGLFDSGARIIVSYFSLLALSAGTFVYHDGGGMSADGAITVPVTLPPSATAGTPFDVVWSHVRAPSGLLFDVQVCLPGAPAFTNLVSGTAPSGRFTAPTPGAHQFRARVRDPISGQATLFSFPASILVQ